MEVKLEMILTRENLTQAWRRVVGNGGAAGVDRKDVRATEQHLKRHWQTIHDKLLSGEYKPAAVKAVEIPKADGGIRRLGVPTVQDRLIQQAMQQVLSDVFEPDMSESSYGYRPKRSAHDAASAARGYVSEGRIWVVDIDLKSFFDHVNHDRLMELVSRRVRDKRILKLVGRYLRAPMRHRDDRQETRLKGTPQGGPLSPLLANIYLGPLDRELEKRGIKFVRYADDIALFLSGERAAERALESITAWISEHLELEVNEAKSGSGRSGESQLLGFRIHETGDVSIAPKAIERFKDKVRALWGGGQSKTSEELRTKWRQYIQGWWNYFGYANWRMNVMRLSGWIRRHMRKCFWLRWHNRAGRYNALKRLGVKGRALGVAGCRRGAWPMANHVVVNQALKTETLNRYGLALPWQFAG